MDITKINKYSKTKRTKQKNKTEQHFYDETQNRT